MFPIEFWITVSVGIVIVSSVKIISEAETKRPRSSHEAETDPAPSSTQESTPVETPDPFEQAQDDLNLDGEDRQWVIIASASTRQDAYDMLSYLGDQGIEGSVSEQSTYRGQPGSGNSEVPVLVERSEIESALEALADTGFREDLLVQ